MDFERFAERLADEQLHREGLVRSGTPYHHWHRNPRHGPPANEYWCGYCWGFFGVRHEHQLMDTRTKSSSSGEPYYVGHCPFLYDAYSGKIKCACIECYVAWQMGEQVRGVQAAVAAL